MLARRPQVQERLTSQVADFLCQGGLGAAGSAVVIEAEHLCTTMRGVKKPGSKVVTSATRGILREDARTRAESFSIIEGKGSSVRHARTLASELIVGDGLGRHR